jgi:hypothetical protein
MIAPETGDRQRDLIHEFLLIDRQYQPRWQRRGGPAGHSLTGIRPAAGHRVLNRKRHLLGGAPARLVINRQEAVLTHAPIGQQRRRAGAGHQEASHRRPDNARLPGTTPILNVGQDPLDGDPGGGVPGRGAGQESRCGLPLLVLEDLGIGQPGAVIQGGVQVPVAEAGLAGDLAAAGGSRWAERLRLPAARSRTRWPPPSGMLPSFLMSTWTSSPGFSRS